jgi:hypothetical protein
MRDLILGCLLLCVCALPARAQEEEKTYILGVYTPGVIFGDSLGKARFAEQVASALSQRTGLRFTGKAFARASDLKAPQVDFAVVDGAWYAATGPGTPLAWASGQDRLVVVGNAAAPGGVVAGLKGKTLILPPPVSAYEGYVSSTLLGHQARARDFFKIEESKDTQSALAAVKLGRAELTVTFQSYAEAQGLPILHAGVEGPLPVAVQINPAVEEEVSRKVAAAFQGLTAPGGQGLFTGFGGGGEGVRAFLARSRSKATLPRPVMAEAPRVRLDFEAEVQADAASLGREEAQGLVPIPPLPEEDGP